MALFGAVASYMRAKGFCYEICSDAHQTPIFFAARPKKAAKSGYSTIQRLMGFNGVLTDGAGGSAQTDLSNLVGLTAALL